MRHHLLACLLVVSTIAHSLGNVIEYRTRRRSEVPSLTVDLGYEIYNGHYNTTTGLNEFKG